MTGTLKFARGKTSKSLTTMSTILAIPTHAISVGGGSKGTLETTASVVGNVLSSAEGEADLISPISMERMGEGSRIHLDDNIIEGQKAPENQADIVKDYGGKQYVVDEKPFEGSDINILEFS